MLSLLLIIIKTDNVILKSEQTQDGETLKKSTVDKITDAAVAGGKAILGTITPTVILEQVLPWKKCCSSLAWPKSHWLWLTRSPGQANKVGFGLALASLGLSHGLGV